jgi:hypothetical protein
MVISLVQFIPCRQLQHPVLVAQVFLIPEVLNSRVNRSLVIVAAYYQDELTEPIILPRGCIEPVDGSLPNCPGFHDNHQQNQQIVYQDARSVTR